MRLTLARLIRWFPAVLPVYVLRLNLGPLPTTVLEILFGILLGLSLLPSNHHFWKTGWEKSVPWRLPIGLWLIATIIALIVAPNHLAAFGLWRAYVLEPLMFGILLLGAIEHEQDKKDTVLALIASVVFIAIYSAIQFIFNIGIPHPWNTDILHRRATGPFPFPNAVALFCAPIAALCVASLVKTSSNPPLQKKSVFAIGYLASLIATLLAKSVGGFIAIAVTTLLALLFNQRTRKPTIIISLALAAIIALTPAIRTPIVRNLSFQDWSGKVRLIIWKETKNMLADRPFTGAGFGAYPTIIRPYHLAKWMEVFQYPHNILLNLWSETGIIGIIAFTWICFTWIKQTTIDKQTRIAYLLPLLAILIHGLVDVPYFKNDLAIEFVALAILATRIANKNDTTQTLK